MLTIALSTAGAKKAANRLREFLAADGVSLQQTHAYEALARTLGYANWNTLQALLSAADDEKPTRKPALSENLGQSLHRAISLAGEHRHAQAAQEHLLLALTEDPEAVSVLRACNVDIEQLRKELAASINGAFDASVIAAQDKPKPTPGFQAVVQRAVNGLLASKREFVTGADVLVALMSFERESPAVQFLERQGMRYQDVMASTSG